ncbi:uncharacterized protein LY79DRAFT_549337 [Colletotrichum navitas]|uniref:Uncharacterized protein n=1 Tax=Colletotrichum navitas TaxID=681940 RepID=A0AAD8V7P9_9PEZI|nr:uncharacterized protein LY79DRAFT_549337 [Colletotrichum navitas]KAK1594650.1 hypothetical protein LY79DRAFT_549337 [Colletotrichum navitas]
MQLAYVSHVFFLLALAYLSTNAQARITIGYRTASREEAVRINAKNTPVRNTAYDNKPGSQIGNGIYLGSTPAGWLGSPIKRNWYCVFQADEALFMAAPKLWIPKSYKRNSFLRSSKSVQLWNHGEMAIAKYVRKSNLNADKTLRFSYIEAHGTQLQMVIPTKMANANSLGFFAKCFATKSELLSYESKPVNWWSLVIKGDPGPPERPGRPG